MSRQIETRALYFGLSLSIFFAFVEMSGLLGLQYNIGFEARKLDLVVISKHTDSFIWLVATLFSCVSSLLLSLGAGRGERYALRVYSATAVPVLGLYFSGDVHSACLTSLFFTLIFVASTTILARKLQLANQAHGTFLTCVGVLGILICIESYALAMQVLNAWFPQSSPVWGLDLQAQLSEFLFIYSPEILLGAIFAWILVVPLMFLMQRKRDDAFGAPKKTEDCDSASKRTTSFLLAIAALGLAVFIPISPYLSILASMNGSTVHMLRGVDMGYYYHVLLYTASAAQLTSQLGSNYTAPYILLLYAIKAMTRLDQIWAVITGPIVLAILFTVTAYFLTRRVTGNPVAAGIAALLGASSFHTTIGLYAGLFENWLAMSTVLVYLLFLQSVITKPSKIALISTIASGYALLVIHVFTWGIMISATVVVALLDLAMLFRNTRNLHLRYSTKILGVILLFSSLPVLLAYCDVSLFPGVNGMIDVAFNLAGNLSFEHLSNILPNFSLTVFRYVGALFAYPEISLLSILGLLSMVRSNIRSAQTFSGWLVATSMITVLLDPVYQWRILYVIPFEILSAAGTILLLEIMDWLGGRAGVRTGHPRVMRALKVLLVLLILVDCGNYGVRSAGLLPFVS